MQKQQNKNINSNKQQTAGQLLVALARDCFDHVAPIVFKRLKFTSLPVLTQTHSRWYQTSVIVLRSSSHSTLWDLGPYQYYPRLRQVKQRQHDISEG